MTLRGGATCKKFHLALCWTTKTHQPKYPVACEWFACNDHSKKHFPFLQDEAISWVRCWVFRTCCECNKIYLMCLDVGEAYSYWVSSLSWSRSMYSHNYKPFHFFIDCEAKTSASVTAHLALRPFFHLCFERERTQKSQNHRQGLEICSLSTKNKLS